MSDTSFLKKNLSLINSPPPFYFGLKDVSKILELNKYRTKLDL